MVKIQEKIIKKYPLTDRINCELNCYYLDKRRYLIFWSETIKKESINQILESLETKTKQSQFTQFKTLVVVGKTTDSYKKEELLYFNNVNTYVVFILIDEDSNKIYINDSWIFSLGLNYKKHVRKIYKILSQ